MSRKQYEYAIKKEILNNGRANHIPVVRQKRRIFPNNWERIVCIYGKYMLMDLDFSPSLTLEECREHIKGYRDVLFKKIENDVTEEVLIELE